MWSPFLSTCNINVEHYYRKQLPYIQSNNFVIFGNSLFLLNSTLYLGMKDEKLIMLEYLQNVRLVTEKKDHFSYLSFSFQTQLKSNITDNTVSSMLSQFLECQPWNMPLFRTDPEFLTNKILYSSSGLWSLDQWKTMSLFSFLT